MKKGFVMKRYNILIVEDDWMIGDLLKKILPAKSTMYVG